jgi:hypothetical protein
MIHPVTAASGGGKPNLLDEKSPTHGSVKSPLWSCLSITLPAFIVNPNHGIM